MKVVRLKMTSEGRVCLGLADVKRYGVPYILGAATQKARVPNNRLCRGTLQTCDIVRDCRTQQKLKIALLSISDKL